MLFHLNSHKIIAGHLLFLGMLQFLQETAIRGPLSSFFSCHPQAQPHPSKPPDSTPPEPPAGAGLDQAPEGPGLCTHLGQPVQTTELTLDGGNKRVRSMGRAGWEQSTAIWGDRGGEEMLEDARIPADRWLMLPAAI